MKWFWLIGKLRAAHVHIFIAVPQGWDQWELWHRKTFEVLIFLLNVHMIRINRITMQFRIFDFDVLLVLNNA